MLSGEAARPAVLSELGDKVPSLLHARHGASLLSSQSRKLPSSKEEISE